jgi:hypothetical protein
MLGSWTILFFPNVSATTNFPYIYHIRIELEQIVYHGGPFVDKVAITSKDIATGPSKKHISASRSGGSNNVSSLEAASRKNTEGTR